MKTYGRWLFGVAAAFNTLVGLGFLSARAQLDPILGLTVAGGTNVVFVDLCAGFIILFGYAYLRAAIDPVRFRPFIGLGVIGKLMAVAVVLGLFAAHVIDARLPLLVGGDLVFALPFADYLRRTRV